MKKSKAVLLLLRLPFLTVSVGAVLLGTSFAWWQTRKFEPVLFVLALTGACAFHIACNVVNDYFDFKSGDDALNRSGLTPFSGGSQMVLNGFVKPGEALSISVLFAIFGSAIGLYLNAISKGNLILFIGIAALFFIYNYNGFPLKLVNKGLGEVAIFLAWGPLMVLGAYYVQAESFPSFWALVVTFPSGILTTLVLLINEFADREADLQTGRKTWVILFGYKKSLLAYLALALSCYLIVLSGVLFGGWPLWSLLVLVTLPLSFMAYSVGLRNLGNWPRFLPAVKSTIFMNFAFLVILSIAFAV